MPRPERKYRDHARRAIATAQDAHAKLSRSSHARPDEARHSVMGTPSDQRSRTRDRVVHAEVLDAAGDRFPHPRARPLRTESTITFAATR
jgi:hypothetical protein